MFDPLHNRTSDVVFLAYHSIGEGGPPFLSLGPDMFERQLALLSRLGFRSGTLTDLTELLAGDRPTSRLAFLTFDDGYLDNHRIAAPILESYGFRALIFVLPPLLEQGAPMMWPRVERQVRDHPDVMISMTWTMVEEMRDAGHEFGSHTLTHPSLPELDDASLETELSESRAALVERLGACDSIAYPFGDWTPRVARAARAAGYTSAFSLPYESQWKADPWSVPRIPVDHRDDERHFRLKLSPAYRAFLLSQLKPLARRVLRRSPAHRAA